MAIKGLTTDVRASFPSLGTLRKGAPKDPNGNRPGKDLTSFRFVGATPEIRPLSSARMARSQYRYVCTCRMPRSMSVSRRGRKSMSPAASCIGATAKQCSVG